MMNLKLMHIADTHLGVVPDSQKPWSAKRARDVFNTFTELIRIAGEEQVDLLLIAGDMFHRTPLKRELKDVNTLFASIPNTRIVLIAGNHDYIFSGCPYLTFPWARNVTFLADSSLTSVTFPELNCTVWGFSYHQKEISLPLYDELKPPQDEHLHILLGHGGDSKHIPFNPKKLNTAGWDYVAMGHIHKPYLEDNSIVVMAGAPEPVDQTDIGSRGYVIAALTATGTNIRWFPISSARYIPLTFQAEPSDSTITILHWLQEEINHLGRENIYLLTITGFHDPEAPFDTEALTGAGQIADITDQSEPAYDIEELLRIHSGDIIGACIGALQSDKKALHYSLQALLRRRS